MTKKLNEKQILELTHIRDWSITMIDFIISKNPDELGIVSFRNVINEAYEGQNLRGIKYLFKDMNEMAKSMRVGEIDGLNKLLLKKFGEDLNLQKSKDLVKINQIIKKAKLVILKNTGCYKTGLMKYIQKRNTIMNLFL